MAGHRDDLPAAVTLLEEGTKIAGAVDDRLTECGAKQLPASYALAVRPALDRLEAEFSAGHSRPSVRQRLLQAWSSGRSARQSV